MTSDRLISSNRANARASTGPKTKAGKTRSSRNALRHGLSLPVWQDPTLAPQADAIAGRIAGPGASAERMERARQIGAAQVDLVRIRVRRRELIEGLLRDPEYESQSTVELRVSAAIDDKSKELARLDRYERRAISRRKRAIRDLETATSTGRRLEGPAGGGKEDA